ncbi:MAG: DUF4376 domain-containing protein [Desulfobacterales bacterium]|nr:DUF4376 domain-containing protein [Desulfobacterales bacterium]
MVERIFGKVGETIQVKGKNCPEGFVVINQERPTPESTCELVEGTENSYYWKEPEKPDAKLLKIEEAASIRKEVETSGIEMTEMTCEDFTLDTDDAGQTKITGAYMLAKEDSDSSEVTKWYTLSGWRDVTNADIIKMGMEVNTHVKKTFEEMERISSEIMVLSDVEVENYEVEFVI